MKKLFSGLFLVIMFFCLGLLLISFSSKKIIIDTARNIYTEDAITSDLLEYIYDALPNLNTREENQIKKAIQDSSAVDSITNKYLNGIIDSIITNKRVSVDIREDLNILTEEMTLGMNDTYKVAIKEQVSEFNLKEVYDYSLEAAKANLSPAMTEALRVYKKLSSDTFKLVMFITFMSNFLLLILVNKSFKQAIVKTGTLFLVFGLLSTIITFYINNNMYSITNKLIGRSTTINLNILFNISFYIIIMGISLYTIAFIIDKIKEKRSK